MALYPTPNYVIGHMGYVGFAQYAGSKVVGPATITDPSPYAGACTTLGPAPYPRWEENQNMQPVDGSASGGMHLAIAPGGARESTIGTTVEVADGTYFDDSYHNIIRNRVNPDAAGLYAGLGLSNIVWGVDSRYASSDFEYQGIDSLVQSFGLTFAEGRPVQVALEWYPICIIEAAAGRTASAPAGDVLHWVHSSFNVGGVDYHNVLSNVRLQHTNNLLRIGQRQQLVSGGVELNISRTNYDIKPGIENTSVSFEFNAKAPAHVRGILDWGSITLRAEHPAFAFYSVRRYLEVTITRSHTSRFSQPEAAADRQMTWSNDAVSMGISITAGTL